MCQTDLPGSWNHPSSDQCRPCCCMMHVSERSLPDQRLFFIYHPHNTVDFRYLHTFFRTHRWKDPCDTAGCHCLSTARRTDQQQIMTSCHCNFCCPSDIFLSTEISKIWKTLLCLSFLHTPGLLHFLFLRLAPAFQKLNGFFQVLHPDYLHFTD